jgi:hypothetical protein
MQVTGEAQPIEVPQSKESCVHARDALSKVCEHTSAYVSIRQHTSAYAQPIEVPKSKESCVHALDAFSYAAVC